MTFEPVKYADAKSFISETEKRLADAFSYTKGFGYISGGIDSTVCGRLVVDSVGEKNFTSIHFDHGGMRKDEPKNVLFTLNKDCGIPTIFRDYSEIFLKRVIEAGPNAEKKRIYGVSGAYFQLALEEAEKLGAAYWVQGTIEPDVIETKDSKLKRQHNVLLEEQEKMFEKAGLEVVEPLLHLRKNHVREVARELGLPSYVTERKPFPGPGLFCRRVGQVNRESMDVLREADSIVMDGLELYTKQIAKEDFQCLVALMDNETIETSISKDYNLGLKESPKITNDKVTGMVNNKRTYTNMLLINPSAKLETTDLIKASKEIVNDNLDKGIGRVAALLATRNEENGRYIAILRSVLTKDFTKADAAPIKRDDLFGVANRLLDLGPESITEVYYDVTPKPPATIEFE
jgi:GMP synthase (glutamine-hydrolysing)